MAAPSFVRASSGATDAGGTWQFFNSSDGAGTTDNIVVFQVLQDGSTAGAVALTGVGGNYKDLGGTSSALTFIGSFNVGSPTSAIQHLWIGRFASSGTGSGISGTNSTSEDLYARMYEFTNVSTGTTLATVIENSTAGTATNGTGTAASVTDTGVTTLGPDRLALNFVAINDDNAQTIFTGGGLSGGTWAEAVAEYAEASGTDGSIGLQTATITTAGTIDGGAFTQSDGTDGWGVVGFALIGTTVVDTTYYPRYGFVHYNDPAIV